MKCNDEISIGEYVKTHKGDIYKVIGIREEVKEGKRIYSHKAYYLDSKKGSLTEAFIIKHSKNIIDLIEEGDYVNGIKVTGIMSGYVYLDKIDIETKKVKTLSDYQIKSVITKEQIKQIEYRIKE